jgi:hypothetical protein
MPVSTHVTRTAAPEDAYDPIAPDGTWRAEWPPEVWYISWRLRILGYPMLRLAHREAVTDAARALYVQRYGHEPPRRGRRRQAYTPVFEHARVDVIDEAALAVLGVPPGRKSSCLSPKPT